ncbi:sporulation membrane protein YtaF [Dethiobacter alkaliphilus]|uniref:Sporulation protein YtaF n=1 Tax=Dethiobacter alkaliphilus AHT 1 TaxID=555088 RepID=C0GIR8_DETAL|nr:sporulation membrane protein YtaF [Dethiobacter alkaliphilus]EEG76732.1 sporulation protein YtaF [Dethiobacter alkaliphilus AHT 1]
MPFVSVIMLGMAVSFDGFGVGFAYGLRRVHIPPWSLLIICLSSALSVFVSMQAGSMIAKLFSPQIASIIGGIMLMAVGFIIIRQSLAESEAEKSRPVKSNEGRGYNYFSGVLREPTRADFDCSGVITGKEAVVLGVALAMDAFAAGFGAAMMGFAPLATSVVVGVTKLVLVSAGLCLGRRYSQSVSGERAAVFAGLALMVLGVAALLGL